MPCKSEQLQTREIEAPDQTVTGKPQKPEKPKTRMKTIYQPRPKADHQRKPVQARRLTADDYDINHRVTEKNGTVEVSGRIEGPRCDALRIKVYARSEDGRIIQCVDVTRLSATSTTFSCSDKERRAKDGRTKDWFVSSLYVRCND